MAFSNKEPELHNEALEEALAVFQKEQSQEHMREVLKLLNDATLIQPALFPKGIAPAQMAQIMKNGAPDPKFRPQPALIKNKDGKTFFPVFTSKAQIPADQKYPFLLFMPYAECAKIAARKELNLDGIAINPFTSNMIIRHQAGATAQGGDVKKVTLNASQMHEFLRNQVERQELPRRLFHEQDAFLDLVTEKKEAALAEIYDQLYAKVSGNQENAPKLSSPYTAEDFEVLALNINEQTRLIQITMPKKNRLMGQCTSAFLVRNPESGECAFYAVILTDKEKPNLLGEVTSDGSFRELGDAPDEGSELYHILGILPWAKSND